MSFITLHQENGLCGYEMSLINTDQVASVSPIMGANKWFVQTSNACIRLTNGTAINVRETVDAVIAVLEESKLLNKKPAEKISLPDAASAIHQLAQKAAAAW
jgi:hypothetical protein